MKSETDTIISALRVLARDIHTDDGVVNTCLEEAAGRLEELDRALSDYIKERNKTVADLIKQRDVAYNRMSQQITAAHSEPSRLEIAAQLLAALAGRESGTWEGQEESIWAIEQADILIATAKETK